MESERSAFSSGGRHAPPHADYLYRCPSWGISIPVSFLVVLLLYSSMSYSSVLAQISVASSFAFSSSVYVSSLLSATSWLSSLLLGGVFLPRPLIPPLPPPPPLPPLLFLPPLPLTPQVVQAYCLWGDGAWPLVGIRPGG